MLILTIVQSLVLTVPTPTRLAQVPENTDGAALPTVFFNGVPKLWQLENEHILRRLPKMCTRYAVVNNSLQQCTPTTYSGLEKVRFETALENILKSKTLDNAIWNYCYEDYAYIQNSSPRGLYLAKASHSLYQDIAAPDWDFISAGSFPPWKIRLKVILKKARSTPFETRINSVFFRGKFTGRSLPDLGGSPSLPTPKTNPRFALFSKRYCDHATKTVGGVGIDIGITGRGPEISDMKLRQIFCGFQGNWEKLVPMAEHCKYKYLVSISGRGSQGIRLKELMACGSVVFMHTSKHKESFYNLIEPWVHVIPYAEDASDLFDKIDWAYANPVEARKIAENGQKLIIEQVGADYAVKWWKSFTKEYQVKKPSKDVATLCGKY